MDVLKPLKRKIHNFQRRQATWQSIQPSLDSLITRLNKAEETDSLAAKFVDHVIKHVIGSQHRSVFWGDRMLTLDKSAGFFSEPSFRDAYEAIHGSWEYDQYASKQTIAWRLNTLVWAARSCLAVEGDFVECGVLKGDMSWVISRTVDFKSHGKQFYLYDTFEGFSDKYSSAADFPENPNFFNFAQGQYSDPDIYSNVCKRFQDRSDIKVIKGVVPDILLKESPPKISFLHIDLNSPAPEIGALEILFPRLSSGGMIVFDDYGWKQFRRQKEAEDEFMRKLGYEILELPTGQGLMIKR